ncbi:hypothetical protein ACFPJ1_05575 [Kribbella qitaiheensis]|uniref:hypothetical protein n=1 Tax=Kribbella qitaiheensis TaxID=1544730 RepID=UPI0036068D3E
MVRLSAEAPALLIQYVAGIAALGAEYTLEASPEAADLIRNVGLSLARTASDAE